MENKSPKITAASIIITVIVFICVIAMFVYGEQEPAVTAADGQVKISGMYGTDFPVSGIKAVSLIDRAMDDIAPDMTRTNGYGGFGSTLKGNFSADTLGDFMLFTDSKASPTILIERKEGKNIYISFPDGAKTKALYEELKSLAQE